MLKQETKEKIADVIADALHDVAITTRPNGATHWSLIYEANQTELTSIRARARLVFATLTAGENTT